MISKILSAVIAAAYVITGFAIGGEAALHFIIFLLLPLACIWFGEAMGAFTGVVHGQKISSETPGFLVAFMGWVLLLRPLIIGLFYAISDLPVFSVFRSSNRQSRRP